MNHIEGLRQVGLNAWTYDRPLYKYSPVESVLSILENNTIKFTVPNQLNDPFELTLELANCKIETIEDEIDAREWLRELWSKPQHFGVTKDIDVNSVTKAEFEGMARAGLEKEKDVLGLLCLSKKYDQTLLWSHYGDKHQGVVLGFEFPLQDGYLGMDVCYESELKPIKMRFSNRHLYNYCLFKWMCTKSSDWAYEDEVRFINERESGFLPFKKEYLTEVYYGTRTSPFDVMKVDKALKDYGYTNVRKRGFLVQGSNKYGYETIYQ